MFQFKMFPFFRWGGWWNFIKMCKMSVEDKILRSRCCACVFYSHVLVWAVLVSSYINLGWGALFL